MKVNQHMLAYGHLIRQEKLSDTVFRVTATDDPEDKYNPAIKADVPFNNELGCKVAHCVVDCTGHSVMVFLDYGTYDVMKLVHYFRALDPDLTKLEVYMFFKLAVYATATRTKRGWEVKAGVELDEIH